MGNEKYGIMKIDYKIRVKNMDKITMKAYAKVNLALDVLRKRQDGYHDMKMVNCSIDLADVLEFSIGDSGIFLSSDSLDIPLDAQNLVVKAAQKFISHYGVNKGLTIHLKKVVPHGAGLAGGSSDAATTLLALNQLFKVGATRAELASIGVTIGADIPYCLYGGTALVEGIGEKISPLEGLGCRQMILIKPDLSINTGWAFKQLDLGKTNDRPDIAGLIKSIEKGQIDFSCMGNVFEKPLFKAYPQLQKIKEDLLDQGAQAAVMTGSGSTLVGYFADSLGAAEAYARLKGGYQNLYQTKNC